MLLYLSSYSERTNWRLHVFRDLQARQYAAAQPEPRFEADQGRGAALPGGYRAEPELQQIHGHEHHQPADRLRPGPGNRQREPRHGKEVDPPRIQSEEQFRARRGHPAPAPEPRDARPFGRRDLHPQALGKGHEAGGLCSGTASGNRKPDRKVRAGQKSDLRRRNHRFRHRRSDPGRGPVFRPPRLEGTGRAEKADPGTRSACRSSSRTT